MWQVQPKGQRAVPIEECEAFASPREKGDASTTARKFLTDVYLYFPEEKNALNVK